MRRPAPRGLAVPRSASAAVRDLPPLDLRDPADWRAALDAVRAHPVVVAARNAATSRTERDAVRAARASLVRRSLRAAGDRKRAADLTDETARVPF